MHVLIRVQVGANKICSPFFLPDLFVLHQVHAKLQSLPPPLSGSLPQRKEPDSHGLLASVIPPLWCTV